MTDDTVDALDLRAFYVRYEGGGSRNQPSYPTMMIKVLIPTVPSELRQR